ncbi:adenine phosphoribosyltransferase [Ilyonectria robusta]
MATLDALKSALRQKAAPVDLSTTQPLSHEQYSSGFDILVQGSGWSIYQDFIIPQLALLLAPLSQSSIQLSVLEIGPGPKSILGYLPDDVRRKIKKYTAFEPNDLFATRLEEWISSTSDTESSLPCLETPPDIHRAPFVLDGSTSGGTSTATSDSNEKFDVILFCHSMYGMNPKRRYIERALEMLVERPESGMVVVFHRNGTLQLDGLVCHRTASFPEGVIRVADDDEALDHFSPFVAGFVMKDVDVDTAVRTGWREACRALGRREEAHPDHLLFSAPDFMAAFTRHATALPELTAQVPLAEVNRTVKNREACFHHPASIVRPTDVRQVQQCVRWALKHGVGLTVIGGGHSGHCLWPNVVSVDMSAFDRVHILTAEDAGGRSGANLNSLVVAEAGCKTGDIVHKTMEAGLTVPLGARPSVGTGLWLQGGIGHLARLHGLACDAIVGAVVVSVDSGQILCVGCVPGQHQPLDAVRPENESELLWAIKGAGTNFGIVVSVTFKAWAAPTYSVRNWIVPLSDGVEARLKLSYFEKSVAGKLPRNCSADAYLYWDRGQLHLGVTMLEASTTGLAGAPTPPPTPISAFLGPEDSFKTVDGVGLFDTEMYMSQMHGGHGSGRTSSFKRCVFLKDIGAVIVADKLIAAVETRPSSLCYLHILHGGGAVSDAAAADTAFGCRDWDFACVVTGVWPRDQDETEPARSAVRWVYNVVKSLLPLAPVEQKLVVLVTGECGAGKDYCADVWVSVFATWFHKSLTARVVSISDATKREYAAATGADLNLLLGDRAYKEKHRPALTSFFQDQVRQRPRLPEEHFLKVVNSAVDVDVLLVTGMRDEAPVAVFSHLVPDSRLLEVRVNASEETRRVRRGCPGSDDNSNNGRSDSTASDNHPSLVFENDQPGSEAANRFAEQHLLPLLHQDLQRLSEMVPLVPNFPRPGIEFRHVLNISQQPGGLALCTSLLQSHFAGNWAEVGVVACCEAGGFVFASALASRVDVPLVLIREASKLPPPTVSIIKSPSHISSSASNNAGEKRIEMARDVVPRGAPVVVVDDVLASGETLCAVLRLLDEAGISTRHVSVMVVAEFPFHRGRELLRSRGFGSVNIQSLLVFGEDSRHDKHIFSSSSTTTSLSHLIKASISNTSTHSTLQP